MKTVKQPDRQELLDERERLMAELNRIDQVLGAMDVIEEYSTSRNGHAQPDLPMVGAFEDLGPSDLVKAILGTNKARWWKLGMILDIAESSGNRLIHSYPQPRNNLGVAANKLAKRGIIERRKRRGHVQYRIR